MCWNRAALLFRKLACGQSLPGLKSSHRPDSAVRDASRVRVDFLSVNAAVNKVALQHVFGLWSLIGSNRLKSSREHSYGSLQSGFLME